MKTFHLKVITINSVFYDEDCNYFQFTASDGQCGILADHENVVMGAVMGPMRIRRADDSLIDVLAGNGFVWVENNVVTAVFDSVETPSELDEKRALHDKTVAEEQLKAKNNSPYTERLLRGQLSRANARLKAFHESSKNRSKNSAHNEEHSEENTDK